METLVKDLVLRRARAAQEHRVSLRSRRSPSPLASAPAPPSSASSTPCCCDRLPYANAQRLVLIVGRASRAQRSRLAVLAADLRDLQQQSTDVFEEIAGMIPAGPRAARRARRRPEQIRVGGATPNLFSVLGARILAGRDFVADDGTPVPQLPNQAAARPAAGVAAILSHAFWLRRFGGDPSDRRQRRRARQRPRARRRRARARLRAAAAAARPQSRARPTCGPRRGSTSTRPTGTTCVFRVIGRLKPGSASSRRRPQADRIADRPAAALSDQADRRPVLPRGADVRRPGRRRPADDRVADGRRGVRAAHRLRQRRQPAGRARVGTQPRARGARRDRRQPRRSSSARCWRRAW